MSARNLVRICAVIAMLFWVAGVQAATSGLFTYTDNGTSITITGYENTPGPVAIPSQIAGKPVTVIAGYAFAYKNFVTSVSIPSSVTFIGNYAFFYCTIMTSVSGGSGVTTISDSAFGGCSSLTSFEIPAKVTYIGPGVFSRCSALTSMTIPAGVTFIGDKAFESCSKLTSAHFLGNAPAFGSGVFNGAAAGFTLDYLTTRSGFTSPTWNGYPSVAVAPTPEIGVQQPKGTSLVDGIAKKSFLTATVGTTGNSKEFTINNTGTGVLKGLAITKNGLNPTDFIVVGPATTSLAPGGSTTFRVTFKPTAAGTRKAAIHLKSNDANESPFDINVYGVGEAP